MLSHMSMSPTHWVILVNALAAVGSFSAAAVALWIATKDRKERQRDREADAQAQANLVLVTIKDSGSGGFAAEVTNYSSRPLLDIKFESARYLPKPEARTEFGEQAPRHHPLLDVDSKCQTWFKFYDGDESVLKGSYGELGMWRNDDPAAASPSNVSVTVMWQDAHGQDWELSHPGRPKRV